ncbi:MAG: UDP-N-acetyl glucosamine 2-epimerase [Chromatiales bacterium]|nr:UDP-N-acetyl glucosamine 2-epimerase [Chromatiales bacterium]
MTRYERLLLEARMPSCAWWWATSPRPWPAPSRRRSCCIPVAHVEAGIRSGDWTMPEEINRMVTDAITNWFFTTSEVANANLRRAGVEEIADLFRRQHHDRQPAGQSAATAPAALLG